ncbi:hypothetical protein LOZ58_002470 [Ophidiomyces ophidiicola]|nr:hypothetical protein LOZ65_000014 [Ophidiomyces ophidiicola]KAI1962847.1 hypothetical protein LOZ58_002470 [Ophidiomyces ophidiicola]
MDRMKLSSTESNLIGTAGNLGTYASGIPIGFLVDSKGPLPATLIGTVALFVGYFPIHRAYASGPGSISVPLLCFFSFLTGMGSCSAFFASIKTAASNFPNHRGSATAFPLAAYGLSAFFFSTIAAFAFHDDISLFLLVLAVGTSSLIFVSSFFIRVLPYSSAYSLVSENESESISQSSQLHRTRSTETHRAPEPSEQVVEGNDITTSPVQCHDEFTIPNTEIEETSSLMARSSTNSPDSLYDEETRLHETGDSLYADLRGIYMLLTVEFWQLFTMLGVLTGIGLMTINNIGYDAKALWTYYDRNVTSGFLQKQQAIHVSTLSVLSCVGRLFSGIGSDLLVKQLQIAQFAATRISDPHQLLFVSGMTGLAYGMLFGVFPSIVAHTFGIGGISQNWGVMTLAAVIGGNTFNLIYGFIFDRNSYISPDGDRDCREGLRCYRAAYWVTFSAGLLGTVIALWSIRHERSISMQMKTGKKSRLRTSQPVTR